MPVVPVVPVALLLRDETTAAAKAAVTTMVDVAIEPTALAVAILAPAAPPAATAAGTASAWAQTGLDVKASRVDRMATSCWIFMVNTPRSNTRNQQVKASQPDDG